MRYLGLDIGTSFIKGGVLDTEQRSIDRVRRAPFPRPVVGLPPSHVEFDISTVLAATRQVLDELVTSEPDCQGIFLTGQMGGIALDGGDSSAGAQYLSWRDQRAVEAGRRPSALDELRQRLSPERQRELGNEIRPGSSLSLLFWLAREAQLPPNVLAVSLPALVAARLCGTTPIEHPTLAIGALDVARGVWHAQACRELDIRDIRWPQLVDRWEPIGTCRLGGRDVPCWPAVGDQQCALLGAGLEPGELSLNISTGSQISLLIEPDQWQPPPPPATESGRFQTRPYFHGRLLNTITHLPAGRALDALVELVTELPRAWGLACDSAWEYIIERAALSEDAGLEVNLAFFAGPLGDQGSLTGMRLENLTIGHLFRAAFHAMASNYRQVAQRLAPQASWQRIVFSGGLARIQLLRRMILDELPFPHRLCWHEEDTLMGLLALSRL